MASLILSCHLISCTYYLLRAEGLLNIFGLSLKLKIKNAKKYSVKTCKVLDSVSVWWIGWCEREVKSNNGVGLCVYVYVTMPLLWIQVNVLEYEMSPVGQTGFCSQTASCHNPITSPFPPCPVVSLLCILFKYCRTTYASVCTHACIKAQSLKHVQKGNSAGNYTTSIHEIFIQTGYLRHSLQVCFLSVADSSVLWKSDNSEEEKKHESKLETRTQRQICNFRLYK